MVQLARKNYNNCAYYLHNTTTYCVLCKQIGIMQTLKNKKLSIFLIKNFFIDINVKKFLVKGCFFSNKMLKIFHKRLRTYQKISFFILNYKH